MLWLPTQDRVLCAGDSLLLRDGEPQSGRQEEGKTRLLTSPKHWEGPQGCKKAGCGQSRPPGLELPLWGCRWFQRKETQSHSSSGTPLQDSGQGQRNGYRAWKIERGRNGQQGGKDAAPWVPDAPYPSSENGAHTSQQPLGDTTFHHHHGCQGRGSWIPSLSFSPVSHTHPLLTFFCDLSPWGTQ